MILELLASEPRTAAATLAALAQLPDLPEHARLDLLTHPNTPDEVTKSLTFGPPGRAAADLPREAFLLKVAAAPDPAHAIERLITHEHLAPLVLNAGLPLSAEHVETIWDRSPTSSLNPFSFLTERATGPTVALRAFMAVTNDPHFYDAAHARLRAAVRLATARGCTPTQLLDRYPSTFGDRARRVLRRLGFTPSYTMRDVVSGGLDTPSPTGDPCCAEDVAETPPIAARPHRYAVATDTNLPASARATAALALCEDPGWSWDQDAEELMAALPDDAILHLARTLTHGPRAGYVVSCALANPYRSADMLRALTCELTRQDPHHVYLEDVRKHPNCPLDLRANRNDGYRGKLPSAGDVQVLPRVSPSVPGWGWSLQSVLFEQSALVRARHALADRPPITAAHAQAMLALEPTFTGTLTDLYDTALAIST